jgi:hypothetical protein
MMSTSEKAEFHAASAVVAKAVNIETLPVIPREIEDVLTIKTSESAIDRIAPTAVIPAS